MELTPRGARPIDDRLLFRPPLLPTISMTVEPPADEVSAIGCTLVLYDGVCGLCNRLVAFLLRHDQRDRFRFAPLQSDIAQKVLQKHGLNPSDLDSVVLVSNAGRLTEKASTRSHAVLEALRELGGIWRAFAVGKIFPLPAREWMYTFIAKRRYRVFGKFTECPIPKPEDRHKFIN